MLTPSRPRWPANTASCGLANPDILSFVAEKKSKSWVLRLAWVGLVAVVVVVAAFAAWQLIGSNQLGRNKIAQNLAEFDDACAAGTQPSVVGVLKIGDQRYPILEGVGRDQLSAGVGLYPDSVAPGQVGNTAIAGYRLTNGEPFRNLLDLKVGDAIQLETCKEVFEYEVVVSPDRLTVGSDDDWVLDEVPGEQGKRATMPMLTLTTSQDLLPTGDRSVCFAKYLGKRAR